MNNNGKKFENNFKKSVPADIFYYRFKDGTASWGKSDNVRFQASNICDCMLFKGGILVLAELKNHKGKSLPFTAIRDNQLKEMVAASEYKDVYPMLIVNFEDVERCYAVSILDILHFIENSDGKKSIPIVYFEVNGFEIPCAKKKVNFTYDLEPLFINLSLGR